MEHSVDPAPRQELVAVLAALAVWWLVPLMMMMRPLGHVGIVLLMVSAIPGYLIFHERPFAVCLWAPLALLSALTVGGITLLVIVLTGIFQPEGMNWAGALILGLILPALLCVGSIAFPALLWFAFLRPRFSSPLVVTAAVINSLLVLVTSFVVSPYYQEGTSVRSASTTREDYRQPGGSIFWLRAEPIYHRSNPTLPAESSALRVDNRSPQGLASGR